MKRCPYCGKGYSRKVSRQLFLGFGSWGWPFGWGWYPWQKGWGYHGWGHFW